MKILIIGNGFDLEHKLPTKYSDFLNFVEAIDVYSEEKLKDDNIYKDYVQRLKSKEKADIYKELDNLIYNNKWIEYFKEQKDKMGDKWIDFEKEISQVVQAMEKSIRYIRKEKDKHFQKTIQLPVYLFQKFSKVASIDSNYFSDIEDLYKPKKRMLEDLNKLIRALEIYLFDYVQKEINIEVFNPDINMIAPNKVLSFNYTDTYEKLYDSYSGSVECDYIHGKADENRADDKCNLILGIDEYLTDEEKNSNIGFIEFKKYFQRIKKRTGNLYKEWGEKIKEEKKEIHEIYIFGHSLDITDRDILFELLNNDNVRVTIFYNTEETYSRMIANLVSILGQENVIRRVKGKNATIIFKQQSESKKIKNNSFEINRDICKLRYLYMMSNQEAEDLVKKICTNIEEKKTDYFVNQENIILLYSELQKIDLDEKYKTILLLIAKNIIKKEDEKMIKYNNELEKYKDYFENHKCCEKTVDFINQINIYNKRYFKSKSNSGITNDKMQILENPSMISGFIDEEMIYDILIEAGRKMDNKGNGKELWDKLYELRWKVDFCEVRDFLEEKKKQELPAIDVARINHFIDLISNNGVN